MRLIDVDALGEMLEARMQKCAEAGKLDVARDYNFVLSVIDSAPTVDAVEVVRCKDCAKRNTAKCSMRYGGSFKVQIRWEADNDFCSWGERKTDD